MEADGSRARVEGTGIGPDDTLTEIGSLQAFVLQIMLDELGHRPVEQKMLRCVLEGKIRAKPLLNLLLSGRLANPTVAVTGGSKGIAQAADKIVHGTPAGHVFGGESSYLVLAGSFVVPELNARSVEEWDKESVHRRSPTEAALGQIELRNHEGMQQSRKVGAWGHVRAGKRFFDGAGTTDPRPALQHQYTLASTCEIGGTGQPIVSCTCDDYIP
jgi:hypothetical protein